MAGTQVPRTDFYHRLVSKLLDRNPWIRKRVFSFYGPRQQQKWLGDGFKYFDFHPYLGYDFDLTNVFERGWNHQLDDNGNNNNNNNTNSNNNNKSKYWEQPTNQPTN